jgi:hypothetical protein
MSIIKISDLQPTGFNLLQDSESYLEELSTEDRLENVVGGLAWTIIIVISITLYPKNAY